MYNFSPEIGELYCGDFEYLLHKILDNFIDLLVLDFPYGIKEDGRKSKSREYPVKQKKGSYLVAPSKNYEAKGWDNKTPDKWVFEECKRVSRHRLYFGANYFWNHISGKENFKTPRRRGNDYNKFLQENPENWLIWDKCNGENDFNDCELIYVDSEEIKFQSRVIYFMWSGFCQGKSMAQGWVQQGNKKLNQKRIHPTEKPILLLKYLLEIFAKKDWAIGDICFGSGTTFKACELLKLKYFGIEKDWGYFGQAVNRLKEIDLFSNFEKS